MNDLSPQAVAAACQVPARLVPNVLANWPLLRKALGELGMDRPLVQVGFAATINVECPPWKPIAEWGDHPEYDTGPKAARLGNTPEADGDGQKFEGRGFLQNTGRANYLRLGNVLKLDLINNPDLLLVPEHSARAAAYYWKDRGVDNACDYKLWKRVRRLVNGGYNGLDHFLGCVERLMVEANKG